MNLLRNGNFEADWSEQSSRRCKVFPSVGGDIGNPYELNVGNVFTPPGWLVWFRHEEGIWAQPECRDARSKDPDRMRSGEKGFLVFTFGRKHHAGLMQQVQVEPGTRLRLTAWAHAWSNHKDADKPDDFPHPDDPLWSEGVGRGAFFSLLDDSLNDAAQNFIFRVGIDPTGGTDPFKGAVIWGEKAHIYNVYAEVPAAEAIAEGDTVTVFLLSKTWWPFKHNDAYWDDARLEVAGETPPDPPSGRGQPRVQYARILDVLPDDTSDEDYARISRQVWQERRGTVTGSYDDPGVGDLDYREARLHFLPVSEQQKYRDWYDEHYSGTIVKFPNPIENDDPPPPPPPPTSEREILAPHIQADWGAAQEYIRQHRPIVKLVNNFEWASQITALGAEVLVRYHFDDYTQFRDDPDKPSAANRFLNAFWDSLIAQGDHITYLQGLNETVHDAATLANSVAFELAVLDELERRGWPGRYVALAPSVGQPPQHDMELMKPLAERLVATGGAMGANCYWPISLPRDADDVMRAYKHPFDAWKEYPGRFELMRTELGMPELPFIITEAGACAWVDWQDGHGGRWDPQGGWRDCYQDFYEYLPHLLDVRERVLSAGNVWGVCLFTTGPSGWPSFHYSKYEWDKLAEAFA